MKNFFKFFLRYPIEFILFIDFFILFKILPLNLARRIGSLIATNIGPLLPVNNITKKNIEIAFPKESKEWQEKVLEKIWHNFGCIMAEYAHLKEILDNRIEVIDNNYSKDFFNNDSQNIIVSAHSSNWEIPGMSCRLRSNKISAIVREPNNPFIRYFLISLRKKFSVNCFSKNMTGTKALIKKFQGGDSIALLADQQLSSGLSVNFFNQDMNISTLPAQIALKSKCKIFLGWPVRKNDNDFEFEIHDCINLVNMENNAENILMISSKIALFYETMIKKYPDQYFWFHNRWKLKQSR
tara:strand:+ start:4654 stop:5541 length:888 start_codon:yes stop_codon:yes gene_type:complete